MKKLCILGVFILATAQASLVDDHLRKLFNGGYSKKLEGHTSNGDPCELSLSLVRPSKESYTVLISSTDKTKRKKATFIQKKGYIITSSNRDKKEMKIESYNDRPYPMYDTVSNLTLKFDETTGDIKESTLSEEKTAFHGRKLKSHSKNVVNCKYD